MVPDRLDTTLGSYSAPGIDISSHNLAKNNDSVFILIFWESISFYVEFTHP